MKKMNLIILKFLFNQYNNKKFIQLNFYPKSGVANCGGSWPLFKDFQTPVVPCLKY